jgi:hypothetical protein
MSVEEQIKSAELAKILADTEKTIRETSRIIEKQRTCILV